MSSAYGGGTPDPDRPDLEKGNEPTTPLNQPPPPPPQQGWPSGGGGYPPPHAGPGQPGQPGPGQPGRGPGQPGPGQPGPGQPWPGYQPGGYGYSVPDHPKATLSLVLGILGVVLCQVLGPFAWMTGKRAVQEIDASQGMLGGRSQAQAGFILGIVGTVLLGLGVLLIVLYFVFAIAVLSGNIANN